MVDGVLIVLWVLGHQNMLVFICYRCHRLCPGTLHESLASDIGPANFKTKVVYAWITISCKWQVEIAFLMLRHGFELKKKNNFFPSLATLVEWSYFTLWRKCWYNIVILQMSGLLYNCANLLSLDILPWLHDPFVCKYIMLLIVFHRFLKPVVSDAAVVPKCHLSALYTHEKGRLFAQLVDLLQFYECFEIDDHIGMQLSDDDVLLAHYSRLQAFQLLAFKQIPKVFF